MKNYLIFSYIAFCVIFTSVGTAFSQMRKIEDPNVYTEGTFYELDGKLYTDAIVVKFKSRVFALPKGIRYAQKSDISSAAPTVAALVNSLEAKFKSVKLMKQVRSAVWGDVMRTNKITGQPVTVPDMSQLYTFIFEKPVPLDSTVNEFLKLPEVEFAHQPISLVYHGNPPDDLHYPDQWNLQVVDAVNAWNITRGLNTIKIGIMDTGVNEAHEDLQSKFDPGDDDGTATSTHGTGVAGIAAAATDNQGKGIASLGWDINLVSYLNGDNVSTAGAHITAENIIDAGNRTDVHVINMSFGTIRKNLTAEDLPSGCNPIPPQTTINKLSMPEDYPEIKQAISGAIAQGTICVASAGNNSENDDELVNFPGCDPMGIPFPNYPAFYPGVIAVSGTEMVSSIEEFRDGWNYSNTVTGDSVDVAAPGVNIWVTLTSGGYWKSIDGGTSWAAPLVSALAALLRSVNPALTVSQVEDIITDTADKTDAARYPYDGNGWNSRLGYGRIDAHAAVLKALDDLPDRTSDMDNATAHNGGRRLVRDGSGNYHLVYQAGNQVFYAKYNANGSWNTDIRLSDALGEYGYPSITQFNNKLYAVWQRKNGNTYDIYFATSQNGGASWSTPYVLASTSLSINPLPVISASIATNYSLAVVFKNDSPAGLKSYYTINTKPASGNWTSVDIPGTSAIHESPSLANAKHYYGSDATYGVAYEGTDGKIYYSYREAPVGSWNSTPIDLSAIVPGSNYTHEAPSNVVEFCVLTNYFHEKIIAWI